MKTLLKIFERLLGTPSKKPTALNAWPTQQALADGIDGEWSLTPQQLAVLHAQHGWTYASPEAGYGTPTDVEIRRMLNAAIDRLAASADAQAEMRGRFLVYRDPDLTGTYDIYLHVGFVWNGEERELVAP